MNLWGKFKLACGFVPNSDGILPRITRSFKMPPVKPIKVVEKTKMLIINDRKNLSSIVDVVEESISPNHISDH